MSSKLILYFATGSPPARATLLLARYLQLDIELKHVDLGAGEQHSDEFLKLNPLHKVPVLVDDGYAVSESRAILGYLVNSREPGSDLYPSDPKARSLVDQRLYFDATVLIARLGALIRPGIYQGVKFATQDHKNGVRDALNDLNNFLEQSDYVAGNNLTIADFSILPTISSLDELGYEFSEYKNLKKWYEKLQSLPGFDENQSGARVLADIVRSVYHNSVF